MTAWISRFSYWLANLIVGDSPLDPVVHCNVYKTIGCTHVDGLLCDVETCTITVPLVISPRRIKITNIEEDDDASSDQSE